MRNAPVHRCVWVIEVGTTSYAVRLLVYASEVILHEEFGHGWPAHLHGVFAWAPRGRRLGTATWLGAICVAMDTADIGTLFHEVCHVAQRMQKAGHSREECAQACASLATGVCAEIRTLGIDMFPPKKPVGNMRRFEDRWDLCPRNRVIRLFPNDPEFETGDALD